MRILGIITASLLLFVASGSGPVYAQTGIVTATVRPNPLKVDLSAPNSVQVGQWFDVNADISNLGSETITRTVVTLNTPQELKVKNQRKKIGNLNSHQTTTVTWEVKANAADNFIILAEVTGNLTGEQISASDSKVISATGSLGHLLLKLIFGV